MITFLISGLWHGANWTFFVWGALNGFYMIFGRFTSGIRASIAEKIGLNKHPVFHNGLKIFTTFLLVNIGWVFFRAKSVAEAKHILKKIIFKENCSIYG
jgi:D-alanyl-lipoteichoic acid acyltransferase DltB (MBOAT superfamily)